MPAFDEFTPRPYDTGAASPPALPSELYKSVQPQAPIEVGNAMRIWFRAKSIVDQTGTIGPELNHVALVAGGVALAGPDADLVVDLLLWRTGDTQGRIGGTVLNEDGAILRIPDLDVLGLNWNRAQQFRMMGASDTNSGIRLEQFGLKR